MHPAKPFRDYTAEEVRQLAAECPWPSRQYLQVEFSDHRRDWLKITGKTLAFDEYLQLERRLLEGRSGNVFYYCYRDTREQFALMQDIKLRGTRFRKVGLVIDICNLYKVGLWYISGGRDYFLEQPRALEIR